MLKKYFIIFLLSMFLFSCSAKTEYSLPLQKISFINSIDRETISLKNFPWYSHPDHEQIASLTNSYQNCTEIISGGEESSTFAITWRQDNQVFQVRMPGFFEISEETIADYCRAEAFTVSTNQ